MYITRLASNEIFSPSNKIQREVGRAKDLSAPLYELPMMNSCLVEENFIYKVAKTGLNLRYCDMLYHDLCCIWSTVIVVFYVVLL
jgi:hypothetical protein